MHGGCALQVMRIRFYRKRAVGALAAWGFVMHAHPNEKAVVLASYEESALLVRFTAPHTFNPGWRIPRWRKRELNGWAQTICLGFKRDFRLTIPVERLHEVKTVTVFTNSRHVFSLELDEAEAGHLVQGTPTKFVQTIFVPFARLGMLEDFGPAEQELLLALKE